MQSFAKIQLTLFKKKQRVDYIEFDTGTPLLTAPWRTALVEIMTA